MKLLRSFTFVAVTAVIMVAAPWDVPVLEGQAPQADTPAGERLTETPEAVEDDPQCNALVLNGTTAYAQRNSAIYPLTTTLASFTAEAWIYPSNAAGEDWILDGDTYHLKLAFQLGQPNGGLGIAWRLGCQGPGCNNQNIEYRNVALHQWNHVAISFDASTKHLRLAINGVVSTVSITNNNFAQASYFRIGANFPGDELFHGYIDEVRISDVPRYGAANFTPDAEFTADSSTRALYHFSEPSGSTLFGDSSPYTHLLSGVGGAQANLSPVCGLPHPQPLIYAGITGMANDGGWLSIRQNLTNGLGHLRWRRVPWAAYNAAGGAVHPAAGNLDDDELDEIVLGLGPGGQGWIAVLDDAAHGHLLLNWLRVPWDVYNTNNGEVYPAVGDVTGDGTADIIAGLGPGGGGYIAIFNSLLQQTPDWRQVNWPAYNAGADGSVHPAVADVNNDGNPELVLGLGAGSQGYLEIKNGAALGYSTKTWIQVPWAAYNAQNGSTYPAAAVGMIAIGLGQGGQGFIDMRRGGPSFAHEAWRQVSWAAYNSAVGETHPALGNLNTIAGPELVVGLAPFASNGGWFEVINPVSGASYGWKSLDWPSYQASGGGIFPAIGRGTPP